MGALELWILRVADVDPEQLELSILDAEERCKAERLQSADRSAYLAAHILLRELLGGRLGVPPQEIAYLREPCLHCGAPHGRPALARPSRSTHFSLSRSGGMVMAGIASVPVGVDIEALPSSATVAEVTGLLHPAERTEINSAAPGPRTETFSRIWTRKEAYLKAIGLGVAHDLSADYLGTQGRAAAPAGWTVATIPVPAGYGAAVAVAR